ncbi:hypothetical protein [Sphingomonas sp. NFR15]|uniref:hypothetical protein n=1 Tax=Sphingomonas sp. NFR15 TaxID=1566282 RepID=UPI00088430BC|nr:hypothetical protein [Sphingomonas sp. NFR15]SDA21605.1 hypothetical protein SAMN03159340_01468 [Sphingomonas sp. NFR15]
MAKISDLELVAQPGGDETVVILKDGVAKRSLFSWLVEAAARPFVTAAQQARDDARTAQAGAVDSVTTRLKDLGFDPEIGYEADLAGVVSAARTALGTLLDFIDPAGNRYIENPLILSQLLAVPALTLGGVSETNLGGYEADLAGGGRLYVDANGFLLNSDDGMGNFPVTGPIASAFGGAFGGGLAAPFVSLNGMAETNLAGFEADLAGGSRLYVDGNGLLLDADDGLGNFPVSGPIASAFSGAFAGGVSAPSLTMNGVTETNALGFEADLVGGQYFVVDGNGDLLTGTSSGASDLTTYATATHADGSITTVELVNGKPQIVTYDGPSGARTVLTSDGNANVAPAITATKQVIYTNDADGAAKRMWRPLLGGAAWPVAPSALIVVDGDSIGENGNSGFTPALIAQVQGRTIQTESIGGQKSDQIARRNGAVAITTAVFAGGQVPAAGAVAVTGIDFLQSSSNRSVLVDALGSDGSVVQGILAFTANGSTYAFTRSVGGAAMNVPAGGATLVVRSGLSQVYPIEELKIATHVYQAGRNDVGKPGYSEDATFANIAAMVDNNMPIAKRWLANGIIPGLVDLPISQGGTRTDDAASLVVLQQIQSLNIRLAAFAGSRFVDMLAAIKLAGLTSQYTVGGQVFDIPNTDFSGADGLHPVLPAAKAAMAAAVVAKMNQKGWLV